jgi:8-oxo-dGTP pyrophosphatase MutT (NUDIX family)
MRKTSLIKSSAVTLSFFCAMGASSLGIVGCGSDSSSKINQTLPTGQKIPVVIHSPASQPAFYQFNGLVGNAPQSMFDPQYAPKSRARNPKHSRESAGALLYTQGTGANSSSLYVLIGKEKQNSQWNFMRGSVDAGDTYVLGASKELNQETGGVYEVSEAALLSRSYDVYRSPTAINYACTFFVGVEYIPADVILATSKKQSNTSFQEMSDYAWIKLDDLISALNAGSPNFSSQSIEGKTQSYSFYQYSFDILTQAHGKNILTNLK